MKTRILILVCLFCTASVWAQTQPVAKAPAKEPAKQAAKAAPKKAPQADKQAMGCCCCGNMQAAQKGEAGKGMMCRRMAAKMEGMGCCCGGHQHDMSAAASDSAVKDPVCGMPVNPETATKLEHKGKSYYFCAQHCAETFKANPDKYLAPDAPKGN